MPGEREAVPLGVLVKSSKTCDKKALHSAFEVAVILEDSRQVPSWNHLGTSVLNSLSAVTCFVVFTQLYET